jgi:hypothetical protein
MLHFLSWAVFLKAAVILALLYYGVVLSIFYRKEMRTLLRDRKTPLYMIALLTMVAHSHARAQTADGNTGISQANTMVRSYFDTANQLLLAVGGIVGLYGAYKVFALWIGGHREEMGRAAAGWFGACIFLVIVSTVIKSFFGL